MRGGGSGVGFEDPNHVDVFYPFKTVEIILIIKMMSKMMSSAHLMSGVNPPSNLCGRVSLR